MFHEQTANIAERRKEKTKIQYSFMKKANSIHYREKEGKRVLKSCFMKKMHIANIAERRKKKRK